MVSLGDKVGVSFPWQYRCFGGCLSLNFESLSVSLALDIHTECTPGHTSLVFPKGVIHMYVSPYTKGYGFV